MTIPLLATSQQQLKQKLTLYAAQDTEQAQVDFQLERKHLLEEEVQQTEHQNQQQAQMRDQLQKYLVVDQRDRTKVHKDQQKNTQKVMCDDVDDVCG